MNENFFVYQRRALGPLLTWGIGSTILGGLLMVVPRPFWRHFGIQAASWGAIDVVLAIIGRRRALLRAEALANHAIDEEAAQKEAAQFQRILLVNAGLDLLYIASGLWTARRFAERDDRRGLGLGIALQGLFLLVFDALLARAVGEKYLQ